MNSRKGRLAIWILSALAAAGVLAAALYGLRGYCVLSGSMEPSYPTGALLLTRPIAETSVKAGMVITFTVPSGAVVTHRVSRVEAEDGQVYFFTRGDANDAEDASPVRGEQLLGTPMLCIPYLGYILQYLRQPPGAYLLLGAVGMGLLLVLIPERKGQRRQQARH